MAFKAGNKAKVQVSGNTVLGMGNWKLNGIAVDLLESTAFGDTAKQFMTGLLDYGTLTFGGLYDPADTSGQVVLLAALSNNTVLTSFALFVDATSYWGPDVSFTGAGVLVQTCPIGIDKSGLGTIEFTGKLTGPWKLH